MILGTVSGFGNAVENLAVLFMYMLCQKIGKNGKNEKKPLFNLPFKNSFLHGTSKTQISDFEYTILSLIYTYVGESK